MPADLKVDIYYQLAAVFLEAFSVDRMGRLYAAFTKLPAGQRSDRSLYFRLLYLQFEVFSGRRRYDEELELKFQELKTAPLPPMLLATLDYHMLLNQFLAARRRPSALLKLAVRQQVHAPPALQVFYSHLICKLCLSIGLKPDASSALSAGERQFYLEMENLFLRKFYLEQRLTLPEAVSLHCFPGFNDYSSFLGNRFGSAEFRLPDVFFAQLPGLRELSPSVESDVWLIADGELLSGVELKETRLRPTLDLRSGAWLKNGRRRFLGRARSLALMTIIGSGSQGASEVLLAERLYQDERITLLSAIERAQNLVTQLKRLGFSIVRKKRRLYFDFAKSRERIFFPKDHRYQGELEFLRSQRVTTLDRMTVCRVLKVSKRTSSLYIKEWKTKHLIEPSGRRYGEYILI
ncbi:MAG: hypothetical protein IPJ84_12660 [Bdellovibrionales bacterium]|nr:hypothetical protein [Bdellovibrionales bacterium]